MAPRNRPPHALRRLVVAGAFFAATALCRAATLGSAFVVPTAVPSSSSSSFTAATAAARTATATIPSSASSLLAKGTSNTKRATTGSATELRMAFNTAIPKVAIKVAAAAAGAALAGTAAVKLVLDRPSRTYGGDTVAREYDAWADDGILEYYWGEHIHLGYYTPEEMEAGYKKKDFIQAKYDFIDKMMEFGNIKPEEMKSAKVLDVGCGFGGTSRYLAKALGPDSSVTGITLSPKQVERGTELAVEQGVAGNTEFMVMDALKMDFPDDTFDIVWACESGEHMPDKKKYIDEMMRVLKPGGKFVMACWSQRDDTEKVNYRVVCYCSLFDAIS